jgi:DNA-binding NarL/FixJ family response regulator
VVLAFQKVRDGKSYLSHELASDVVFNRLREKANKLDRLTPRELQTLTLVAEGKPYGEIADELEVSYKTVANICTQLKTKLGARTRPELMRIAIQYLPETARLAPVIRERPRRGDPLDEG